SKPKTASDRHKAERDRRPGRLKANQPRSSRSDRPSQASWVIVSKKYGHDEIVPGTRRRETSALRPLPSCASCKRRHDQHVGIRRRREQALDIGLAPLEREPLIDVALVGDLF